MGRLADRSDSYISGTPKAPNRTSWQPAGVRPPGNVILGQTAAGSWQARYCVASSLSFRDLAFSSKSHKLVLSCQREHKV